MKRYGGNLKEEKQEQKSGVFPDLDKYLKGKGRHLVNYSEGAMMYRIPYYTFVQLAKKAKANYPLKKTVIVDIGLVEAYLMEHPEELERLDVVREV